MTEYIGIDFWVDSHSTCCVNYENDLFFDDFGLWFLNAYWNLLDLLLKLRKIQSFSKNAEVLLRKRLWCCFVSFFILQVCSSCKIETVALVAFWCLYRLIPITDFCWKMDAIICPFLRVKICTSVPNIKFRCLPITFWGCY